MKWLAILTLAVTLGALALGITVLTEFTNQQAMLSEYELLLAGDWEENQRLKKRLGVFYIPKEKEVKWEKK